MKILIKVALFIIPAALLALSATIKDITKISSQRENFLIGYGIIVGLPQTGDSKMMLAKESLDNVLRFSGIQSDTSRFISKNTAAVMVMSKLPPVSRSGDHIDIWISSIGDAKSLSGGFLLQTALQGQDGEVYAIAQTQIPIKKTEERYLQSDASTTLFVAGGAIIEKNINQPVYSNDNKLRLSLRSFNINNLDSIRKAVEKKYPQSILISPAGLIEIQLPDTGQMEAIAIILGLPVDLASENKVVIDSQSGTIVMGNNVKISRVGLTKNGIIVKIKGSSGEGMQKVSSGLLEEAASVEDLVKGLNALGLSANEIIDIIKTIHAAGALHGELIVI